MLWLRRSADLSERLAMIGEMSIWPSATRYCDITSSCIQRTFPIQVYKTISFHRIFYHQTFFFFQNARSSPKSSRVGCRSAKLSCAKLCSKKLSVKNIQKLKNKAGYFVRQQLQRKFLFFYFFSTLFFILTSRILQKITVVLKVFYHHNKSTGLPKLPGINPPSSC